MAKKPKKIKQFYRTVEGVSSCILCKRPKKEEHSVECIIGIVESTQLEIPVSGGEATFYLTDLHANLDSVLKEVAECYYEDGSPYDIIYVQAEDRTFYDLSEWLRDKCKPFIEAIKAEKREERNAALVEENLKKSIEEERIELEAFDKKRDTMTFRVFEQGRDAIVRSFLYRREQLRLQHRKE